MAKVGRFGDTVDFRDLNVDLQTDDMAAFVGAATAGDVLGEMVGMDACGSPGEVANDPILGNRYRFEDGSSSELDDEDFYYPKDESNEMLWTNVVSQ